MSRFFELPSYVAELALARNRLKDHYASTGLRFTLDGNLVGDIGEAVAAELFGLQLTGRSNEGIDGYAPDGRSVQVKASGTGRGAAFRPVETSADYLLFFHFDIENCAGTVVFNGPENLVTRNLPEEWTGQRSVGVRAIRVADAEVLNSDRLPMIGQ